MDVLDTKPQFQSVARTRAVFQDSTITYNEAGITYNEPLIAYGGADAVQHIGPNLQLAWNPVPQMQIVRTPTTVAGTVTLYAGMPMGLLLALTYPTTTTYEV